MHSVVVSDDRLSGGGVVLNAEFLHFAAHCGFQPRSCRPYRARTKGEVKRPIRTAARASTTDGFVNDADVNDQAERWIAEVANVRQHGTTGERPVDRFERVERLSPLPLSACRHPRVPPASVRG